MEVFRDRSSALRFLAKVKHAALEQRYAPRPLRFPVASSAMSPSGVNTTRTNSRFGSICPQPTHFRSGIFFTCGCNGPHLLHRYQPRSRFTQKSYGSRSQSLESVPTSSSSSGSAAIWPNTPNSAACDSLLISIFHPVSFAASRAFCPSLPIASDSW